jgi:FtsP/CotA-like multicopper oxidase with cupredoxin domain
VIVKPGASAQFDLTANEPGDWAFHCHLLYHMHGGMMQTVTVMGPEGAK